MASELATSLRYANRTFFVASPGNLATGVAQSVTFDANGGATGVDNTLANELVQEYPHEIELVSQV